MSAAASTPGASVRLEVRVGSARPAVYEVGDGGFLIGSVPGCDLRLPGVGLPPVICLIARHSGGASLRKLAPVQPIGVNGRSIHSTYLADGDCISVGSIEVIVHLSVAAEAAASTAAPEAPVTDEERARVRQQALKLQEWSDRLTRQQEELARREAALRQPDGGEAVLSEQLRERQARLLARQHAVRRATRRAKARLARADERVAGVQAREDELASRQAELDARREQLDRERQLLDEQIVALARRQQELQADGKTRLTDLEERERRVSAGETALEQSQKQYKDDLVRLDRLSAGLEARQQQLDQRTAEAERRFEQLQHDSRDLEEQAAQMDQWHGRLTVDQQAFEARRQEQAATISQLEQRAAAMEGQQAMLASLRTRLERVREELRREEQALSEQRLRQEEAETELRGRLDEVERLRDELLTEHRLFEEERRRFEERRGTLEQAVSQLRQAQTSLHAEQQDLQRRQEECDVLAAEQAEQAELLVARAAQLEQISSRLQTERQTLQERESALARSQETLTTLQEQIRCRFEDLDAREQRLVAGQGEIDVLRQRHEERYGQAEELQRQAARELEEMQEELTRRGEALAAQQAELAERQEAVTAAEAGLTGARDLLTVEQAKLADERQAALEQARHMREEALRSRDEAQALAALLPELETRAAASLERLDQTREALREHLAEVHTYARQSRDDLEAARRHVQVEAERIGSQQREVQAARDEHRLAVTAYRQQLIDWQVRVAEMRQALKLGTTQLERRQAEVEQQARQVADTTARLAEEAVELERQRRQVAERNDEMARHLVDMREWYRRKLRDLAGVDLPEGEPAEGDIVPLPPAEALPGATPDERDPSAAVLSMADEIDPADRQLGELLASLELVDDDTLQALWAEARRQRRSLRQLLLAGGYLTLYQMALIEAGTLDALVLGPVRVIDRLPSGPREAVYRVFDPTRNVEAVLRHLAEAEMHDAVHPDEFQQRFAAAAGVRHGNIAGVLEVLTIHERPAALLEWVNGLPASEWPALVAAPGVWYRLLCQAALALQATHAAGLCHGHLDGGSFVLTGQGVLKLLGIGEPLWLVGAAGGTESVADDLAALGRLAASWAATAATGRSKAKPLPEELQTIVARLQGSDGHEPFATAEALVEELERAGSKVPSTSTAWDRLLRQVRDQGAPEAQRQSA